MGLLKGKLRTADGAAMSPTSTHRPAPAPGGKSDGKKRKRLVRYYVSQQAIKHGFASCPIKSVNAEHLDELVRAAVLNHLDHPGLSSQTHTIRDHWVRESVARVELSPDRLRIELDPRGCKAVAEQEFEVVSKAETRPICVYKPTVQRRGDHITLDLGIQIKRLDGRRVILAPDGKDLVIPSEPIPRPHIIKAIGQAYHWFNELDASGEQIRAYAARTGTGRTRMLNLLPLVHLGPIVLHHAFAGTLPPSTTLDDLLRAARQLDWQKQAESLGIA
ncbi:MAG: recombinase zinc beta ribbon domain-containing protein [Planctomycetota bacterium]